MTLSLRYTKKSPYTKEPTYASIGAACFDLRAAEGVTIGSWAAATVDTGLAFEIPPGYVMLVFSRSGHGFKNGVRLANCTGVIDSDYRGSVMIRLHNDGLESFAISPGDRIAQAMIVQAPQVQFIQTAQLSETERGAGGFGSTGND